MTNDLEQHPDRQPHVHDVGLERHVQPYMQCFIKSIAGKRWTLKYTMWIQDMWGHYRRQVLHKKPEEPITTVERAGFLEYLGNWEPYEDIDSLISRVDSLAEYLGDLRDEVSAIAKKVAA